MPSLQNGVYISCSFSISNKDASGNFTITATLKSTAGYANFDSCRLSCSLTNTDPWSYIGNVTLTPGSTWTGSRTFSSGTTSTSTVYCYLRHSRDGGSSVGGGYTVNGYVNPITYEKKYLSASPTTLYMGEQIFFSDTAGQNVSSTSHTWSGGGSSGTFSLGNWTAKVSDFEPLCLTSNEMNVAFSTNSYWSGGSGTSTQNIKLKVPTSYVPTASHIYEYIDAKNEALVAGYSKLKVTVTPGLLPDTNSATITSCELYSVTSGNSAVTVSSFTKSGNVWTSGVLPSLSGSPSYELSLTFRITDSRGNVLDYTTEKYRVTNFIPPYCYISNLKRDTETSGTIDIDITSPSAANLATLKIGSGSAINVKNKLVAKTGGYTLHYSFSGLTSGNQYNIVFSYQDTNMYNYGEAAYNYTQLLSTIAMPISLYDDGSVIATSFGEECADNYGYDCTINFAKSSVVRGVTTAGNVIVADSQYVVCPFPVGSIYMNINSTSPDTIWTGTTWEQIMNDAYLKIVTTRGGKLGGTSSEHKIPISSLPSHTHDVSGLSTSNTGNHTHVSSSLLKPETGGGADGKYGTSGSYPITSGVRTSDSNGAHSHTIDGNLGETGNDEAYYPYYFGVYVWKRTT